MREYFGGVYYNYFVHICITLLEKKFGIKYN